MTTHMCNDMRKANLKRSVIFCVWMAAAIFCNATNMVERVIPYGHVSNTVDRYRQEMAWLRKQDEIGVYDIQSNRNQSLQKIKRSCLQLSSTNSAERVLSLLAEMPHPGNTPQASFEQAQKDKDIRTELSQLGVVPAWTGTEWINGLPLMLNEFNIPDRMKGDLVRLNLAERSYGIRTAPDQARKSQTYFSGRPDVNHISAFRQNLWVGD